MATTGGPTSRGGKRKTKRGGKNRRHNFESTYFHNSKKEATRRTGEGEQVSPSKRKLQDKTESGDNSVKLDISFYGEDSRPEKGFGFQESGRGKSGGGAWEGAARVEGLMGDNRRKYRENSGTCQQKKPSLKQEPAKIFRTAVLKGIERSGVGEKKRSTSR